MKQRITDFQKKLRRKYKTKYRNYRITQFFRRGWRKPYDFWNQNHWDKFARPRIWNWSQKYYPKKRQFVETLCTVFSWVSFLMCLECQPIPSQPFPKDNSRIERTIQESCLGDLKEELEPKTVRRVDGSSVSTVDKFKELRLKDYQGSRKSLLCISFNISYS